MLSSVFWDVLSYPSQVFGAVGQKTAPRGDVSLSRESAGGQVQLSSEIYDIDVLVWTVVSYANIWSFDLFGVQG